MYKDSKRTCTAIGLLIKPFVWGRSRCRRRRLLLKLPNNEITELMLETANVEVNDLNALVSNRGVSTRDVTVYIFDTTLFFLRLPDTTVRSDFFLARRPDWGGRNS